MWDLSKLREKNWLLLTIFIFSLISLLSCSTYHPETENSNTEEFGEYPILEYEVTKSKAPSFIIKLNNKGDFNRLYIADKFSNVKEYVKFISLEEDSSVDYSNFILSINNSNIKSYNYIVNFPIYWRINSPYGYLSDDFGITEAFFLFFKPDEEEAYYDIDFSNLEMDIYNSAYGNKKHFFLTQKDLFETYFVFGDYSEPCVKKYGDYEVKVLFGGDFEKNDTICKNVFSIYDYFYNEFGKPSTVKTNFTITFAPARMYSSRASGFYAHHFQMWFVAHELFHTWQTGMYNCSNKPLYFEGLTSFYQWYTQYEAGIIDEDTLKADFNFALEKVKNIPNLNSLYYLDDNGLYELRKKDHDSYYSLVYYKGALIWKEIHDSGISVNDIFTNYLKTRDCTEISNLIAKFEKELFDKIIY